MAALVASIPMLTPNQAKLILSHSEPLVLNSMVQHPISPAFICITHETLRRLGIDEPRVMEFSGYDGIDYLHGKTPVHVFDTKALEKHAGITWEEYESARRDAKSALEIGG